MTDLRVVALERSSPGEEGTDFGSGYLVADRLILTAAHVAGSEGETLEARLGPHRVTGTVIWRAHGDGDGSSPDAALIEIDDPAYRPIGLPPVRWGWIVSRGPAVRCSATGYPDALVQPDGVAEPEQVPAEIMPLTRGSGGLVDVVPTTWPESAPGEGTLWSGMSGAAVLSDADSLVIAIIVEVADNYGDRRLTALSIASLRHDRSFTEIVERHTGHPFHLEPVELEETLRPWRRFTRPQSPIALLRPEYEVVPFYGRAQALGRLVAWCESDEHVSGLLIHAPGGTGKTRLARQLAQTMYSNGWVVGELSDAATTLAPFSRLAHPVLLLIDYAESRTEAAAALLRHVAEHPGQHPVRVLMLARSAGPWWEQILNDETVAGVLSHPPQELSGLEFAPGSGELLTMVAGAFDTALRQVPGYESRRHQTPAFKLPWILQPQTAYLPLNVHIAVLASVLDDEQEGSETPTSPAQTLLRHEKKYWNRLAAERSLGHQETRDVALVFGLLCGAHNRQRAARTIGLLPGFRSDVAEEARRSIAHWIAALYPPADPRAEYWGQLAPDWLFEYLLAATVAAEPEMLDNLASTSDDGSLTHLTGAQLYRATTVLTAAAAHAGENIQPIRFKLMELVAIHNHVFLPFACLVSMQTPYPEPLLTALRVVIGHPSAQLSSLYSIRSHMQPAGGVLSDLGLLVQERIVSMWRDSPEGDDAERHLARELTTLSSYLGRAGRIDEAVLASGESAAIHRRRGGGDTDIEEFVIALTNHATNLTSVGNHTESYQICQEVVHLLDHSDLPREDRRRLLVGSLNNICLYHERNGEFAQACEAVTRAVALQREELACEEKAHLFPEETLAQLLINQFNCLEHLGRTSEALAAAQECTDIWRGLYHDQPGTYADPFQAQATRLARMLQTEGQHAKAASLYGEAAQALTWLSVRDSKNLLSLGVTLMFQAQELSHAGAPFASVVHLLERACAALGTVFRQDPQSVVNRYLEALKTFIQGAQLVAEDIDIKPYMAEVANVYDYVLSLWESAGRIPDDVMTVPNFAMYVSWAIEDGDFTTAIELCERVEALSSDTVDADAHLDQKVLHATLMMLRAKALARRGDVPEAVDIAKDAAARLADCATPENYWPAFVAAEGLWDVARHASAVDAPRAAIALSQAGAAIALRYVAVVPDVMTPVLDNNLALRAQTHAGLGEHDVAAALLEEILGHVRELSDRETEQNDDPLVTFDIRRTPTGPSGVESLDQVLSLYITELRELGRDEELLAAMAELVELRRRLCEADGQPGQTLSYAWIARIYAQTLVDGGRPEDAAAHSRAVVAALKDLPVTDEGSQKLRAMILHESAIVLSRAEAADEALIALSICMEIYRTDPHTSPKDMASTLDHLSIVLSETGRLEESCAAGEQALTMWRRLAAQDADELVSLGYSLHNQALIRGRAGREDESRALRAELEALLAEHGE
ncbi:hypothetical protein [Nonomuraea wenchangensis]|uniref:Tetratricopeptide repeat-containing protein n=1 Tax=Nonomuraea wenchangensis TaxID=568860 RepID=A0A1I0LQC3_9ACTN|nr:hypothetical protein [Nonomuraea wenchangensis]SEU44183.1 hypothetical protein SAMN05421811_122179 [Nonomuraea wenchangensis]